MERYPLWEGRWAPRPSALWVSDWFGRAGVRCVAEDLKPGLAVRAVEQGLAQVFERLGPGDALE